MLTETENYERFKNEYEAKKALLEKEATSKHAELNLITKKIAENPARRSHSNFNLKDRWVR